MDLHVFAVHGIPEVTRDADLAGLIGDAVGREGRRVDGGDVFVVAQKAVSKAEGAIVRLDEVAPSPMAALWASEHGKDARIVEVIFRESRRIVRMDRDILITETHHGFVCANAGVDASNAPAPDTLVLLPRDPDASARALRAALPGRPAVVIADSFGRAWRNGQVEVAIGVAGLRALDDWRGRPDTAGREMRATWIAIADEAAAAADLVRDKDSREPAVVVRGLERHVTPEDGPGAAALLRPRAEDLFA